MKLEWGLFGDEAMIDRTGTCGGATGEPALFFSSRMRHLTAEHLMLSRRACHAFPSM